MLSFTLFTGYPIRRSMRKECVDFTPYRWNSTLSCVGHRPRFGTCAVVGSGGALLDHNFGARVGTFMPLYMPNEIAPIKLKMLDLDVPSITLPTAARHSVEGATLPAGILIWGKPRSDRQLLALGMALEKKLAPH